MKKNIPNYITVVRIVGTIALLFLEPYTPEGQYMPAFFIVYTLCGLSDVADGTIARAMHITSALGAKLDSVADLSYYAVMTIKIFPVLLKNLSLGVWSIVIADFAMRIISYSFVAIKYRRFSSRHTYMNKLTGFAVFTIPYYITTRYAIPLAYIGAVIAGVASVEELWINFSGKALAKAQNERSENANGESEQKKIA